MTTSPDDPTWSTARQLTGESAPSAVGTVDALLARIASLEPQLSAVLETDPVGVRADAAACDAERADGRARGPLHGVPFLLKGNVDIGGSAGGHSPLLTTAGSTALVDAGRPAADAPVLRRLRQAGALLLGTANLSQWANFRSAESSSGWSSLGGQCRNPHELAYSPGGSSAGSGVAVAAGYAPFAIGTETDGSILCPASLCGVVGMKPTLGSVPSAGVIPIAASQDVVGPLARTVADAALVLGVLADHLGEVRLDRHALRGRRIGVSRSVYTGYDAAADAALEQALAAVSRLGAVVVDPAEVTTAADLRDGEDELTVLLCEIRDDLPAYLATRSGAPSDLDALIAWNGAHADVELAYFGQDLLERAAATGGRSDPAYGPARERCVRLARTEGLDATFGRHEVDALIWPTYPRAWRIRLGDGGDGQVAGSGSTPTAVAGYPAITVPAGVIDGLPLGVQFAGPAGSDALLLSFAYAFEQATHHLVEPGFRDGRCH